MAQQRGLTGYRRPNGAVGTRNYVAILPVDDLSNAAAEGVAALIPGTLALPHAFGRLQFGDDLELTFRTLIGIGSNPNVAAVRRHRCRAELDRAGGRGHRQDRQAGRGDVASRATATSRHRAGARMCQAVPPGRQRARPRAGRALRDHPHDQGRRVRHDHRPRVVPGHGLPQRPLGRRRRHDDLRRDQRADRRRAPARRALRQRRGAGPLPGLLRRLHRHDRSTGANLLGSQPTQGNIAGGLSTIEEKALGNIVKTGTQPVVGALAPAEAPTVRGLHFMDTSSAAAECVTLMAAGGGVRQPLPDRSGQPDRQPDPARRQDLGQPEDGGLDGRAHRRRLLGPAARTGDSVEEAGRAPDRRSSSARSTGDSRRPSCSGTASSP